MAATRFRMTHLQFSWSFQLSEWKFSFCARYVLNFAFQALGHREHTQFVCLSTVYCTFSKTLNISSFYNQISVINLLKSKSV